MFICRSWAKIEVKILRLVVEAEVGLVAAFSCREWGRELRNSHRGSENDFKGVWTHQFVCAGNDKCMWKYVLLSTGLNFNGIFSVPFWAAPFLELSMGIREEEYGYESKKLFLIPRFAVRFTLDTLWCVCNSQYCWQLYFPWKIHSSLKLKTIYKCKIFPLWC